MAGPKAVAKESVMVFTSEPHTTLVERLGTGNWRASATRVKGCEYVVLARHAKAKVHRPDSEEHRAAFLIGRSLSTRPSKERGRIVIEFLEYAGINVPNAWPGAQNPVAYLRSDELAAMIPNFRNLKWHKLS